MSVSALLLLLPLLIAKRVVGSRELIRHCSRQAFVIPNVTSDTLKNLRLLPQKECYSLFSYLPEPN